MGLHDGKHKESQLGWKGKQWGIWNREAFTECPPVADLILSEREHALFLRILRKWDQADRLRREQAQAHRDLEKCLNDLREFNGGRVPPCFSWSFDSLEVFRRPKPRLLHRGNLLRLLDGDFVKFVIVAIQSGRVGVPEVVRSDRITSEMIRTMGGAA
jgi:hypothetical protein